MTAVYTLSAIDGTNSPYTVKVTNGSGLTAELTDAITADTSSPTFTNAVDTTVSLFDSGRDVGIPAADLCEASGTVGSNPYSISSGNLPGGLTLNTATGAISGTADAVGTDTTSTFTIAAQGDDATATRQFKITIKAPVITSITSTGAGNFSVPLVSSLNVMMGKEASSSLGSDGGMLEGTLTQHLLYNRYNAVTVKILIIIQAIMQIQHSKIPSPGQQLPRKYDVTQEDPKVCSPHNKTLIKLI